MDMLHENLWEWKGQTDSAKENFNVYVTFWAPQRRQFEHPLFIYFNIAYFYCSLQIANRLYAKHTIFIAYSLKRKIDLVVYYTIVDHQTGVL